MKIPLLYTVTIFVSLFYAELESGSLLQIVGNLVEGNCNSRRGTKVTCANVMRWFDVRCLQQPTCSWSHGRVWQCTLSKSQLQAVDILHENGRAPASHDQGLQRWELGSTSIVVCCNASLANHIRSYELYLRQKRPKYMLTQHCWVHCWELLWSRGPTSDSTKFQLIRRRKVHADSALLRRELCSRRGVRTT